MNKSLATKFKNFLLKNGATFYIQSQETHKSLAYGMNWQLWQKKQS